MRNKKISVNLVIVESYTFFSINIILMIIKRLIASIGYFKEHG